MRCRPRGLVAGNDGIASSDRRGTSQSGQTSTQSSNSSPQVGQIFMVFSPVQLAPVYQACKVAGTFSRVPGTIAEVWSPRVRAQAAAYSG